MKNRDVFLKNMKIFLSMILLFLSTHIFSFAQNLEWKLFNNECGINVTDIFEYEPNKFIVKSEFGFFKIHDGITEEIIFPLTSNYKITSINMDSNGILYVATERDGIFRYDNLKNEWENITYNLNLLSTSGPHPIEINKNNEIVICISKSSFYKLNDSTQSWAYLGKKLSNDYFLLHNNGDIYSVNYQTFSYLPFGDTSWININILEKLKTFSPDYQDVQTNKFKIYEIDNRIYLINHDSGLFYSDDFMKTMFLNNVVRDVFNNFIKLLITKEKEWIMLSSSEGVLYSNNNAITFEQNNGGLPTDSVITGIITKNEKIIVSIKNNGLYISEEPNNIPIPDIMVWIDRPNFKIRKVFNNNIMDLKYSNDGEKIYASVFAYGYGGNHEIQLSILDIESGRLIKNHRIPSGDLMSFKVSDDDKYIIAYYLTYIYHSFDYTIKVVIYDIDDLSIKHQVELDRNYPKCNLHLNVGNKYFSSIYDDNKKELIFSYSILNLCPNGSNYHNLSEVVRVDFNHDLAQIKTLYDKPVKYLTKTDDNKILFWEHDFTDYKQMDKTFESYLFKLADMDFSNQIIIQADSNMNNNKYSKIYNFNYNRPKNHLVIRDWNDSISIYDLKSNSLLKKFRLKDIYTNTYDFSVDGNRMLIFHNKGVAFFKYPEMELLDSIPFKYETGYWWRPAMSSDNISFAVGTYDGVVRLFKDRLLANVIDEQKLEIYISRDDFFISPNPATDFITIQLQTSEVLKTSEVYKVQIFDMLGIEVFMTQTGSNGSQTGMSELLKIDVAHLPAGVYFIRIGDRVEKFVKM